MAGARLAAPQASLAATRSGPARALHVRNPEALSLETMPVIAELDDSLATLQFPEAVPLTEWRALFHDSPLAIAYVSPDLRLVRVNGRFAMLCGCMAGEVLGRHCYEVCGEEPAAPSEGAAAAPQPCPSCRVAETLQAGAVVEFDRPHGRSILHVVASPVIERWGEVTGAVLMIADVTSERAQRQQVIEAQRLATVGTMTSGVAHELRNPLTSILGFAQLLRRRTDLPEGARAQLERIWTEAQRCDHIVSNLLKFTRRSGRAKAPVDVNRVVIESLDLLRHPLQAGGVQVHQALHPQPLQVMGHFCELQQVVQNIVKNALDALSTVRGGNVTLRTLPRDASVLMEFENDGPRIAEPHKLFQPFFTTKEPGKGTGLGLSVSDAIVRDHGGRIEAMNAPGGVLFRITLPRIPSAEAS